MTTTFDPELDLVDPDEVQIRQQATVCTCVACRAADATEPPVMVPHALQVAPGRWRRMGRWLHGFELRRHLQVRDQAFQRAREAITRHGWV